MKRPKILCPVHKTKMSVSVSGSRATKYSLILKTNVAYDTTVSLLAHCNKRNCPKFYIGNLPAKEWYLDGINEFGNKIIFEDSPYFDMI